MRPTPPTTAPNAHMPCPSRSPSRPAAPTGSAQATLPRPRPAAESAAERRIRARGERIAHRALQQAITLVVPGLQQTVEGLAPEVRHAVGLHFGWWDREGRMQEAAPTGKMIRPALVLASCRAAGGTTAKGLPAALAVELIHNASLLHDDLIDHDETRRGRPTLWAQLGLPAAILAGDALFFLAIDVLAHAGGPLAEHGVPRLTSAVQELIGGEYIDTLLEHETAPDLETVEAMAAGKTGALIAQSCALGAMAADAPEQTVEHLAAFGAHLGAAFQLIDDLLGIWGDEKATGKPVYSDLRSRKKSLPVTTALATNHPAAEQLRNLYTRTEPFTEAELPMIADLLEQTGARAWTEQEASWHTRAARTHLAQTNPRPSPAAELAALADLVTHRDH